MAKKNEIIKIDPNKLKTRAPVASQSTNIPHTNKKKYNRKPKHKEKLED